jgi:type II secretory pathway pseudopilin PulG
VKASVMSTGNFAELSAMFRPPTVTSMPAAVTTPGFQLPSVDDLFAFTPDKPSVDDRGSDGLAISVHGDAVVEALTQMSPQLSRLPRRSEASAADLHVSLAEPPQPIRVAPASSAHSTPFDLPSPEFAVAARHLPAMSGAVSEGTASVATGYSIDDILGTGSNPFDSNRGVPPPSASSFDPFAKPEPVPVEAFTALSVGAPASVGGDSATTQTTIPSPTGSVEGFPEAPQATPAIEPSVYQAQSSASTLSHVTPPVQYVPTPQVPLQLPGATGPAQYMVPGLGMFAMPTAPSPMLQPTAPLDAMGMSLMAAGVMPQMVPAVMQQLQLQQQMQQMQQYQQMQLHQMQLHQMMMGSGAPLMGPQGMPLAPLPSYQPTGAPPTMAGLPTSAPIVLPAPGAPAVVVPVPLSVGSVASAPPPAPGPTTAPSASVVTSAPPSLGGSAPMSGSTTPGVWASDDVFGQPSLQPPPVGLGARRPLPQVPDDPFANLTSGSFPGTIEDS